MSDQARLVPASRTSVEIDELSCAAAGGRGQAELSAHTHAAARAIRPLMATALPNARQVPVALTGAGDHQARWL